jgi:Synergist-CTERM protein sorting domain-containing protein
VVGFGAEKEVKSLFSVQGWTRREGTPLDAPLAGTRVTLISGAGTSYGAVADEDGVFVLSGLPGGAYRLNATRDGYAFSTDLPVVLSGDDVRGLELVARKVARASWIQVNLLPGDMGIGARFRIDGGDWRESGTTETVQPGRHRIDFLAPAGYMPPSSLYGTTENGKTLSLAANFAKAPTGGILGRLDLGGLTGRGGDSLDLRISPLNGGDKIRVAVSMDAQGFFSADLPVSGDCLVAVKPSRGLSSLRSATLNGAVSLDFGTRRLGDADGDDAVSLTDFSLLAGAFGTGIGGANYASGADFDDDRRISIRDFAILAYSYGQTGDAVGRTDLSGGATPEDLPGTVSTLSADAQDVSTAAPTQGAAYDGASGNTAESSGCNGGVLPIALLLLVSPLLLRRR